jgi:hypothetical protein
VATEPVRKHLPHDGAADAPATFGNDLLTVYEATDSAVDRGPDRSKNLTLSGSTPTRSRRRVDRE